MYRSREQKRINEYVENDYWMIVFLAVSFSYTYLILCFLQEVKACLSLLLEEPVVTFKMSLLAKFLREREILSLLSEGEEGIEYHIKRKACIANRQV